MAADFNKTKLIAVPNCNFTFYEADLLIVNDKLQLIDVEIKISRSDLKADAHKRKWVHSRRAENWNFIHSFYNDDWKKADMHGCPCPDFPRTHPKDVWKHYYAIPEEIWKDELFDVLPSECSGVLLMYEWKSGIYYKCIRKAKPNKYAKTLSDIDVAKIARLANLRMWSAYRKLREAAA